MEFQRRDRVVELVREELAGIVRRIKDPRLSGFLTLTGVDLAPDMKSATAYYSLLGSEEEKASSALALESAAGFVYSQLKTRLRMKVVPYVTFAYDRTPERAGRVLELLTQIEQERSSPPRGEGQGEGIKESPKSRRRNKKD